MPNNAKVWKTFEGSRKINGKVPTFWIQTVTPDLKEDLMDFLEKYFQREEPLHKYSGLADDQQSVEDSRADNGSVIDQGLTLVCLTKGPTGKDTVAAVSLLVKNRKDEPPTPLKGECSRKVYRIYDYLWAQCDPFELLGVDVLLKERGLCVAPEYRGQGLGLKLMELWTEVANSLGLKGVLGMFSSKYSQRISQQVGYKTMVEVPYVDMAKYDPTLALPGIEEHTKTITTTYKLCE